MLLKLLVLFSLVAASLQEDPKTFATKDFSTIFSHCTGVGVPAPSARNPIQLYRTIEFNGRQYPCGIEAVITPSTRRGRSFRNDQTTTQQMQAMGARYGDEKGHLIGVQFGGPAEWYNMIPMSPLLNRNVGNKSQNKDRFFNKELSLGSELRNKAKGRHYNIPYQVAVNYDLPNTRPIGIRVKIDDSYDRYFANEEITMLTLFSRFFY